MSSTAMRHEYEIVYITQPELDEEGQNTLSERFNQTIGNFDGEIISTEPWGRRTLAYPINNFFEGHYTLLRFKMQPEGADELERFLRFNDNVIRHLLIRTDS